MTGFGKKGTRFCESDHWRMTSTDMIVVDANEPALMMNCGSVYNDFVSGHISNRVTTRPGAECIIQFVNDNGDRNNTFKNYRFEQMPYSSTGAFVENWTCGLLTAQKFANSKNNHPQ